MSIRVAVIGTGWADKVQIPAFQAAGLEIVAVAGRNPGKTRAVAERHGIPRSTTDWRDLLEEPADLISITSPPAHHRQQAIAVLEAGRHLLCEKPLALDADEARAIQAAAAAHPDRLALLDHELRFCPARSKARELIRGGALGRVLVVTARVALNTRMDPDAPWTWWSDAGQGGGVLGAIGSHVLDGIRWLLADLGEITVNGATLGTTYPVRRDQDGTEREVTADDIASVTFSQGGAVGTMLIHSAALDDPIDLLTIRGTRGTLILDRSLKLYVSKQDGILKEYRTRLPAIVPNRFRASPYAAGTVLLGRALLQALTGERRSGLAAAATIADGLAVQELLDEIRRRAS